MLRAVTGITASQRSKSEAQSPKTGWLYDLVVPTLQSLSRRAYTHPIHTVAFVAIVASTTYLKLLDTDLFEPPESPQAAVGQVDFPGLLAGSRTLQINADTAWKWQNADDYMDSQQPLASQELALMTLVFPESTFRGSSVPMPQSGAFIRLSNTSFTPLPPSKNLLSPISQESTLAFSVPLSNAPDFVGSVKELGVFEAASLVDDQQNDGLATEEKRWIMSAVKGDAGVNPRNFKRRATDAWNAFVDLLKNAEELDIIIMALGYISMHLTFVSLFASLRKLGSNAWLGTAVLTSSVFAMLFGLIVTFYFDVPINMVLLSEGLPFLVVIIGFEKPIILTKAVLSASLTVRKANQPDSPIDPNNPRDGTRASSSIQRAVQNGVADCGVEVVRDYAIEIFILVLGAASRVQGGLCQFCFLAAWILFFDCILLFTFYTAFLTIKLEINRIKRHVALRRALEEDGVSRKVAEQVAASDEWPSMSQHSDQKKAPKSSEFSVFGMKAGDSSISRFKVLMVSGFIAINLVNFATIPFRSGARSTGSAMSTPVTQPPMDPFKVAGNGLESIAIAAKKAKLSTLVTILTPIKYELQYPSVHYAVPEDGSSSLFDLDFTDGLFDKFGGRVVEGILKSFEDPFLGKWIIIALALSLILNGYLFNAARWTIKDVGQPISDFTTTQSTNGHPVAPHASKVVPVPKSDRDTAAPAKSSEDDSEDDEGIELKAKPQDTAVKRNMAECESLWHNKKAALLHDEELVELLLKNKIPGYKLEQGLGDMERAVKVRRSMVARTAITRETSASLEHSLLPYKHYDYERVFGACCENVIGYLPLPLGVAGPLVIDGQSYYLPMATTEGVLVASTNRGCKALNAAGGVVTVLTADGMTRGPCVGFPTLTKAAEAKVWLDSAEGFKVITDAFNSTSRFARLQSLKCALAGTYLYIRFKTTTGDAMGMNMISKGVDQALKIMSQTEGFEDMSIISVSGNFCIDKKPAAINWIDGRGKSVVAEAIIPGEVIRKVLKSDVNALVELNTSKNLIGSALAGSIGGFNAHAANIVAAIFLATGQDPAQVVESANCITVMKNNNGNLQLSVSMPSIEVGTIGGGTVLPPQSAMLDMLGVRGAHPTTPGSNARRLARIVAASVMAGELSLCSALAAGHLVQAHMQHNRSAPPTRSSTPGPSASNTPMSPTAPSMTAIRSNGAAR